MVLFSMVKMAECCVESKTFSFPTDPFQMVTDVMCACVAFIKRNLHTKLNVKKKRILLNTIKCVMFGITQLGVQTQGAGAESG